MKQFLSLGIVIFFLLQLAGCATNRNPSLNARLAEENWRSYVETDPNLWTKGADTWFLTGDPNRAELKNRQAPASAAISTMRVIVPDDLNRIKIDGAFQVQIFGTDEHNSVYLYGPNEGIREVAVDVDGKTLYVYQTEYAPPKVMKRVIVRIGIRFLNQLTQMGCGSIEAIQIRSSDLHVSATPTSCGHLYLSGNVNLKRLHHAGTGNINIFGAFTPDLEIRTSHSGNTNIVGKVGVRSIKHEGTGNINIIGVNSGGLSIDTTGSGKISLDGPVVLRSIQAKDHARVYAPMVDANNLKVIAADNAQIGLAGSARNLIAHTSDCARFYGRYLCAQSAYVRAYDTSHMNVTASNKIFASASQDANIFFFGPENLLSQFSSGDGSIIPMGKSNWCNYGSEYRSYSYTYDHPRPAMAYAYCPEDLYFKGFTSTQPRGDG